MFLIMSSMELIFSRVLLNSRVFVTVAQFRRTFLAWTRRDGFGDAFQMVKVMENQLAFSVTQWVAEDASAHTRAMLPCATVSWFGIALTQPGHAPLWLARGPARLQAAIKLGTNVTIAPLARQ